jgi:hypothetical protein
VIEFEIAAGRIWCQGISPDGVVYQVAKSPNPVPEAVWLQSTWSPNWLPSWPVEPDLKIPNFLRGSTSSNSIRSSNSAVSRSPRERWESQC